MNYLSHLTLQLQERSVHHEHIQSFAPGIVGSVDEYNIRKMHKYVSHEDGLEADRVQLRVFI